MKSRDIGIQKRVSFEVPPQYIGMRAIIVIGGTATNNEGRIWFDDPTTIQIVSVGKGFQGRGRIRYVIPDDQRGCKLYAVVVP